MAKRVYFTSEKNARSFSDRTGGNLHDMRNCENAKGDFLVRIDSSSYKDNDIEIKDKYFK